MMGPDPRTDELDLVSALPVDDQLRAFVDDLRATYAFGPPPETGAQLATVLARGLTGGAAPDERLTAIPPPREPRARHSLVDRLQGRRPRLALAAAVAGLTVFGTGAAGALPGPVQPVFERAVEAVGIDLPDAARTPQLEPEPAESAPTVSPTPGDSSGGQPSSPPPAEPTTPPGQGSKPVDPGPAGPQGDGPNDGGTGGARGGQTGSDTRPGPPDGVPVPVAPGPPEERPGAGPPPGVPGGNVGDPEEAPEEGERPGSPDRTPGATAPSGPGEPQPGAPAGARARR